MSASHHKKLFLCLEVPLRWDHMKVERPLYDKLARNAETTTS